MAEKQKQKPKDLDSLIRLINKKSGATVANIGLVRREYKRIQYTSPRMNYCTYGGLPEARLIEYFGEEHGGKTTTALDNVANFQQTDERRAMWVDVENTLDPIWAEKLGVNLDELVVVQPETESAEELFQIVLDAIATGQIGFAVIDSFGAMTSMMELEKDISDATYAGISQALTKFSRQAEMAAKKYNCTIIGINQLRDDLRATYGRATKTVGGRAWKHMSSVRMEFRQGSYVNEMGEEIGKSAENPAGIRILMSMEKNKTCPPNRRGGYYTVDFANGINYLADLIEVAEKYELVQKSGSWYVIIDPETGEELSPKVQGRGKIFEFLQDEAHEDVLTLIENFIEKKI